MWGAEREATGETPADPFEPQWITGYGSHGRNRKVSEVSVAEVERVGGNIGAIRFEINAAIKMIEKPFGKAWLTGLL
jgi:hypothetical protein